MFNNKIETWYIKNKNILTGGGIWMRGREINSSWSIASSFRVLVVRLSTYRDTSDSQSHGFIHQIVSSIDDSSADFAYLPPPKDGRIMTKSGIPWLFGIKSKMPHDLFDVIAVSNSIVQELVNISVMLEKSGIPVSFEDRVKDDKIPLIILGGANAANTSLLWHSKSPVDGIFIGGDTDKIKELFLLIKKMREAGKTKKEILSNLVTIQGFFQSSQPVSVSPYVTMKIPCIKPEGFVVHYSHEAPSASVPVSEGCPHLCAFCAESWQRKPYREADADEIFEYGIQLKKNCGFTEIGIYSFNFNIYTNLEKIIFSLLSVFRSVGLKSQRFDMIARQPSMLEFVMHAGKRSITCGLEGISSAMRNYFSKSLTDEDLYSSLSLVLGSGVRELKIFIVAAGIESEDDFSEFDSLLECIAQKRGNSRIIFSVTPLVCFPHTPLENSDIQEPDITRITIERMRKMCTSAGFEFREAATPNESFLSQIMLRGGEDEYLSLIKTAKREKFIYYDGVPQGFTDSFRRMMKENGKDVKRLMRGFRYSSPITFNSSVFSGRVAELSSGFKYVKSCCGTDSDAECSGCGICSAENRKMITGARKNQFDSETLISRIKDAQRSEVNIECKAHIDADFICEGRKYLSQRIARAFTLSGGVFIRALRFVKAENISSDPSVFTAVIFGDLLPEVLETAASEAFAEAFRSASVEFCGSFTFSDIKIF